MDKLISDNLSPSKDPSEINLPYILKLKKAEFSHELDNLSLGNLFAAFIEAHTFLR